MPVLLNHFRIKNILLISISAILLSSCSEETNSATNQNKPIPEFPEIASTAMPVKTVPLLLPFHLDSLIIRDTVNFFSANLYFPVAGHAHYRNFNLLALQTVKSKTEGYNERKRKFYETVIVEAWVSEMSVNKNLVSFCFTDQNFTQGAAHYNHDYTTLNYDTEKNKQVFLTDIFDLDSENQKLKFCAMVNPKEEGLGPDLLDTSDINSATDFMITDGRLIFCFGDSDRYHWFEKKEFPLVIFAGFIRPEYRWLVKND